MDEAEQQMFARTFCCLEDIFACLGCLVPALVILSSLSLIRLIPFRMRLLV